MSMDSAKFYTISKSRTLEDLMEVQTPTNIDDHQRMHCALCGNFLGLQTIGQDVRHHRLVECFESFQVRLDRLETQSSFQQRY